LAIATRSSPASTRGIAGAAFASMPMIMDLEQLFLKDPNGIAVELNFPGA
jgi:hypothetical protein